MWFDCIYYSQVRLLQRGCKMLSLKCNYQRDCGNLRFSLLVAWAL